MHLSLILSFSEDEKEERGEEKEKEEKKSHKVRVLIHSVFTRTTPDFIHCAFTVMICQYYRVFVLFGFWLLAPQLLFLVLQQCICVRTYQLYTFLPSGLSTVLSHPSIELFAHALPFVCAHSSLPPFALLALCRAVSHVSAFSQKLILDRIFC